MIYLFTVFWPWLVGALALGLLVGFLEKPGDWRRGLPLWLAALLVGMAVAAFHLIPDRPGFWFEVAVMMLGAYLAGALLAGAVRGAGSEATPASERVEPDLAGKLPVGREAPKEVPVEPQQETPKAVAEAGIEEAITGLSAPRAGKGDDLTRITGVDAGVAANLNGLGLYHYDQFAVLTPGQRRWLFRRLGFEGRFPSYWWRWRHEAEALAKGVDAIAPTAPAADRPSAPQASGEPLPGEKPAVMAEARGGKADDLKRIKGIGKQNEGRLHGLGIWHFDQIAGWSAAEAQWVGAYLAFPGRIEREDWIGQAKILAAGGITEFAKRADAGEVATSRDDSGDDGQANVIAVSQSKPPRGKKPE